MKKRTIYILIGIAAVAGLGIYGYSKGWFDKEEKPKPLATLKPLMITKPSEIIT
jgi:hypothetical protein